MDLYDIRNSLAIGKSIFDIPMRVTYYARVSTDKDAQLHSLSAQVNYYNDFISKNQNWILVDGYIDEGISGTSVKKRESFIRMMDDARLDKFDFIITKEISRFSRNTLDSIKYTQQLLKNGVGVLFESDNINTLMPDSELRLTIMASIAQDEVRKTSERVKFGFKRAIEKGVVLGNNKIWGYNKENGRLVINESEAEMVRMIFDLYANENMGMRSICTRLSECGYKNSHGNDFSFSTIKGILTNPKYKGYYCGGKSHKFDFKMNERKYLSREEWTMYKDEENVPPIVSEGLWEKANSILNGRQNRQADKAGYQNKYKYSGKLVCAEHGVNYHRGVYRYKSGDKEVWRCKKYIEQGRKGCTSPMLYTSHLDEALKLAVQPIAVDRHGITADLVRIYTEILSSSNITADIARVAAEIDKISAMKDKLLELSIGGRISDEEFQKRNDSFNEQIKRNQTQLYEMKEEEQRNKSLTMSVNTLRSAITRELDFQNYIDESVIDALVDKIEVYKTSSDKVINLKFYFKLSGAVQELYIDKREKTISFCYGQYI